MIIQFDQLEDVAFQHIFGQASQNITSLAFHSKHVKPGAIFFSIKGEAHDGHQYIDEAIERGAAAVIGTSLETLERLSLVYLSCTFLVVENVRDTMALLAKRFHNRADEQLKTIGVTGTNGKTTVAAYVRSLLTLLELPTGSIGTTGIWSSSQKLTYKKSTPTTPESIDLHQIFHDLADMGDKAAVMEVSSIATDQKRVHGIHFDAAILTNFSEEHLEYHKTMDHYKKCKLALFEQAKTAVINIDDEEMGKELAQTFNGPKITYSLLSQSGADLTADMIEFTDIGSTFDIFYQGKIHHAKAPVFGTYNIANVLAAIGTAIGLGYKMREILQVLPMLQSPEGRFQVIAGPDNRKIILDYAHTPVALTRLVEEVKKMDYNRLIVMIAGIGIRDFNKMPKMAAAIEGQADEVIVTVDHPGHHDPQIIIDQVMTGFSEPKAPNIQAALTREEGVIASLSAAEPDDIILLTSGCINGAQIVKGQEIPHSDEEIIESHYDSYEYDCHELEI
ncbi:UDP-N-acetylmuramoyl-L-alanyl-D-glutamate--2,6-diaminopimelate ligase [Bacillus sp. UMB0893]|uniref:UDP-N-acetylmuramoyl-L-alanyl-D-glutamate--2, 6-diaminopimelate ligase n=1 Tax=Bacillus sp. UMB0893 TaxID=2066053 RepID=UPI000C785D3F|nr:UDP-N-acetylmuramoyl-L-alanyl-D-glutamate--2,6-diaminopimelate ligase [Bacillus sp. UMB0893]PLR66488.1 UDP-N-acetylmuramoyl-L-alanyl-D-glutamate--2,6-diaminopimelate ligase [Bacillus sp. UMB0893]